MPWVSVSFRETPVFVPNGVVLEVKDEAGLKAVPYEFQGALDLYTDEHLKTRRGNRHDARVCRALEAWWEFASGERHNYEQLWRERYLEVLDAIGWCLLDDGVEASRQAHRCWCQDARCAEGVAKDRWFDTLFELADQVRRALGRTRRPPPIPATSLLTVVVAARCMLCAVGRDRRGGGLRRLSPQAARASQASRLVRPARGCTSNHARSPHPDPASAACTTSSTAATSTSDACS